MAHSDKEWDDIFRQDSSRFWVTFWAVVILIIAVVAGSFVLVVKAHAHMHDRPDLSEWLKTLYSFGRGSCCDNSEAETMADPDWRNASEMKKDECVGSDGNTGPLTPVFCVRLENPDVPGNWKWWVVPKAAVVELPNKAGPALIWLIWNNRSGENADSAKPYIRCFLPGTLS